jgi:glutamate formiminotransferase / 5-formyltetrahydrofolate cyclo-ligase
MPTLLAVPNASEGEDAQTIAAIAAAFAPARVLDIHTDPDHGRSVFTLAGAQGALARSLVAGAREAARRIDLTTPRGRHPHVGALDVVPVVYRSAAERGPACAEALTAAALIGDELSLPVFLYGELATDDAQRERADLRAGGPTRLAERIRAGELEPDFGPHDLHPRSGAVLVTARPPLIAFNLDLQSGDVELARRIAAELREAGGGFRGVRAIGLYLSTRGRAQVSVNVHDYRAAPLAQITAAVAARADIAEAELVGLAPAAAFEGFPVDVRLRGFDASRHLLENALEEGGSARRDA